MPLNTFGERVFPVVHCIVFVVSEWREKWMSHYRHTLRHTHFVQFPQNSIQFIRFYAIEDTFNVTIAHNYRSHWLPYFHLTLWVCIFDSSFFIIIIIIFSSRAVYVYFRISFGHSFSILDFDSGSSYAILRTIRYSPNKYLICICFIWTKYRNRNQQFVKTRNHARIA